MRDTYNAFKQLLSSAPILAFSEPRKPFVVETDASKYSVGGVLSQRKDDGEIHQIAYFSLALSKPSEIGPCTANKYMHW